METEEYTEEYPLTIILSDGAKQAFSKLNEKQLDLACHILTEQINKVYFEINQNEK